MIEVQELTFVEQQNHKPYQCLASQDPWLSGIGKQSTLEESINKIIVRSPSPITPPSRKEHSRANRRSSCWHTAHLKHRLYLGIVQIVRGREGSKCQLLVLNLHKVVSKILSRRNILAIWQLSELLILFFWRYKVSV